MTKDEIMALAEKVGLTGLSLIDVAYLESFAELVAAVERESCAITAWSAGMDAHNAARGLPCDARDIGSKAASAIRARGKQ